MRKMEPYFALNTYGRLWSDATAVPNAVLGSSSRKSFIRNMAITCAPYAMVTTTKAL